MKPANFLSLTSPSHQASTHLFDFSSQSHLFFVPTLFVSSHFVFVLLVLSHFVFSYFTSSHLVFLYFLFPYFVFALLVSSQFASSHLVSSPLVFSYFVFSCFVFSYFVVSLAHRFSPFAFRPIHASSLSRHLFIKSLYSSLFTPVTKASHAQFH